MPTCCDNVQAYIGVHTSAWSYNSLIQAWEPILEPWNLIMKADMNTGAMVCSHLGADFQYFLSAGLVCNDEVSGWLMVVRMIKKLAPLQNLARFRLSSIAISCRAYVALAFMRYQSCEFHKTLLCFLFVIILLYGCTEGFMQSYTTYLQASHGVEPGAHISIKSTSELMRVTLAYAAAQSMFRALRQWRDLHTVGADEAYRRQLAAADTASVHTHVTNTLGVAAEMQLDFGDRV